LRDSRILPIYEGTNGIQAIDLVTRKLPLEGGAIVANYLAGISRIVEDAHARHTGELGDTAANLKDGLDVLNRATDWMGHALRDNPDAALAGATPYLRLFGLVAGAGLLTSAALRADARPADVSLARFFAEHCLTVAPGLAESVIFGASSVLADAGVLA
jgi:hypothetical protein